MAKLKNTTKTISYKAFPQRSLIAAATAIACASPSWSNPTGGQVVSGSATISTPSAASMVIDQSTARAIINWNSFSIGAGESVRFNQPSASSIALNRVLGNTRSEIFGSLSANGQIFLVNPNGVLMARGAEVSASGFLASSLGITDADFLAGRHTFTRGAIAGSVINEGTILTPGGYTALLAPNIINNGLIAARLGSVVLAAGERVTLDLAGDGLIRVAVDEATLAAAIKNGGTITADGGRVILTAKSANALLDTVLNNEGVIRADTLVDRGGVIALESSAGIASNSGSLLARGQNAGERGGTVSVTSSNVLLTSTAVADASGMAGGGNVFIGGNWQGQGPLANARNTHVDAGARIDVSATDKGDGGTVVVWADGRAHMGGDITARGGPNGGDGGKVETSGKGALSLTGGVDMSAPNGKGGAWLLDPTDIIVFNTTMGVTTTVVGADTTFVDTGGGGFPPVPAFVDATAIGNAITGNGVVTVQTSNVGIVALGSITVDAPISAAGGGTLNLIANGDITVRNPITAKASNALNLGLYAGSNGTPATIATAGKQSGNVTSNIVDTGGGTFTVVTGTNGVYTVGGGVQTFGGNVSVNAGSIFDSGNVFASTGKMSLTTSGGNISMTNISASELTVQTGGGNFETQNGFTLSKIAKLNASSLGAGSFKLVNDAALSVDGVINAAGGITLSAAGPLTLNAGLNAGTNNVSLTTSGGGTSAISQTAGVITANSLGVTTAGAGADLTQANQITKLNTTSLGNGALNLKNAAALEVSGAVTAAGGITLQTAGDLAINNTLNSGASGITLTHSAGNITESDAGGLQGTSLNVTTAAGGNVTLTANSGKNNTLSALGTIDTSGGTFKYSGNAATATMASGKITAGSIDVINEKQIVFSGNLNATTGNISLEPVMNFGSLAAAS